MLAVRLKSDRTQRGKERTVKKALTIMVGLLAAVSLFAVIAAASDGETTADTRASATAATVAERAAEPADDSDGDGQGRQGLDRDREHERGRKAKGLGRLAAKLASEGLISEDQVAAVEAWFEAQGPGLEDRVDGPADVLAAMVADGVITQAQADDIAELMSRREGHGRGGHLDMLLKGLASEGVISEDQIPAVKAWFEAQGSELEQDFDGPAGVLAALVADGVITQAQADDITELIAEFEAGERDFLGRLAAKLASEGLISEDQVAAVEAWFEAQGSELEQDFDGPAGVLAALVADGVITQAQADDIAELMSRREGHGRGGHLDMLLKGLASEGVISEDQIPAVKAWFEAQGSELEQDFAGPAGVLAAMVSDGVITQAQADDIIELMSRFEAAEAAGGEPDLD